MKSTLINLESYITPDKPYNKCIACQSLGAKCDGPNFLAMSGERWCEWCKLRKEYLGWSNADVAELSGISKASVDRIFSGHGGDLRMSTMESITKALVNGTWGQFPCADPDGKSSEEYIEMIESQKSKIEELHEEIRIAHAERRESATHVETEQQKKVDYLKKIIVDLQSSVKWYKRVIGILAALTACMLLVDVFLGGFGWIRY